MTTPTITQPGIDELTLPNHPETKVLLKHGAKYGDRNRVQSAAILARRRDGTTDPAGLAGFIALRTLVMIHDWTVTDESGKKVIPSVEAIDALDAEDGEFLEAEARKRYDGESGSHPLVNSSDSTSHTESNSTTPEPSESQTSENS